MKRKDPPWIIALILALVLSTASWAQAWPSGWQPADKAFVVVERGVFPVGAEVLQVEVRVYEDGAEVLLANGRPSTVDPDPSNPCTPFWLDNGMARLGSKPGDPDREIPSALWRDPDWQLVPSQSPLCKEA